MVGLNLERLDHLANISRVISAVMGAGTVLAVFFTSRLLFEDYLGAFLAGLALALSQLFVFYSHVGNVDVPCVFWFVWGVYWGLKAVYIGRWRHFVLMGLCFSLSICTKDAMVGYVAGMVPAFWLAMIGKNRADFFKEGACCGFGFPVFLRPVAGYPYFSASVRREDVTLDRRIWRERI